MPYLKSQGVTRLDLAVMTHGDQDHMNGIRYLLEHPESGIRVGGLMMPEAGKDEIYGKMAELAKKRDIPVFYAQKGDIWNNFPGKGMSMECLSPDGGTEFTDRNEESLVFRLTTDVFHAPHGRYGDIRGGNTFDFRRSDSGDDLKSRTSRFRHLIQRRVYRKTVPIRDDPHLRKKESVRTPCGESPESGF